MKTLPLLLDDDLDAALNVVSAGKGRSKADLAADVLRSYVQKEKLRQTLQDPVLIALYQELADEDVQMSEEGMAEYQQMLEEADRS